MESKTENYVFISFGNGISHTWEQKSTTGRFATGRFWLCTWKISSVSKDQVNNWELCILKITPLICFYIVSTDFLVWSLSTDAPFDFVQVLLSLSFSFIMPTLLSVKGCCYLLVDMKFLLLCSCVQLLCLLCSLVSYWVKYSKRMSISTCACTLFSI